MNKSRYSLKHQLLTESLPNLGAGRGMTRGSWGMRAAAVAMAWVKTNFPQPKLISYAPAASIKGKSPKYAIHLDVNKVKYTMNQGKNQSAMDLVWESGGKTYNAEVKSVDSFSVPTEGSVKLKLTLEVKKDSSAMRKALFQNEKGKSPTKKLYSSLFEQSKDGFEEALKALEKKGYGKPTRAKAKRAFIDELVDEGHHFVIFVGHTSAAGASIDDLESAEIKDEDTAVTFSDYGTSGTSFRPTISLTFNGSVAKLGTGGTNFGQGASGTFTIDDVISPEEQTELILDYVDIVQKQYRPAWEWIFQQCSNISFATQQERKYPANLMDVSAWLDGAGDEVLNSDQTIRKDETTRGFKNSNKLATSPPTFRYEDPTNYPCAFFPSDVLLKQNSALPKVPESLEARGTSVREAIEKIRSYYSGLADKNPHEQEDLMYFGMFTYLKNIECTANNMVNVQTSGCGDLGNLADRINCKPVSGSSKIRFWENVLYSLVGFDPAALPKEINEINPNLIDGEQDTGGV